MADPTPLLWHFPISHFAEKARWALDYKAIEHRRQVLLAGYLPRVWWATGRRSTLPLLHLDGRAIGDSTEIIAALEARYPEPALYPEDPALRERALALEDWFDEVVGHPVRTLIVPALVEEGDPERVVETLLVGSGAGMKRLFLAIQPVFQRYYYLRHGIGPASRTDAPAIVQSAFERVEAELSPSGYLVGDRFSVADLTAAALLAPLVRPPGTIWGQLGPYPPSVEEILQPLRGRDATEWVRGMYTQHRCAPAET